MVCYLAAVATKFFNVSARNALSRAFAGIVLQPAHHVSSWREPFATTHCFCMRRVSSFVSVYCAPLASSDVKLFDAHNRRGVRAGPATAVTSGCLCLHEEAKHSEGLSAGYC